MGKPFSTKSDAPINLERFKFICIFPKKYKVYSFFDTCGSVKVNAGKVGLKLDFF
jgi:hypothetical protein